MNAPKVAGFWDGHTRNLDPEGALELFGTVTEAEGVVRLRDQLEKAHFKRVVALKPTDRVLDLGGGAGRFALWLAPRVAQVTVVDESAELLHIGEEKARALGLHNVTFVKCSAVDYVPSAEHDVVLCMGLLTHLSDDDVQRMVRIFARGLREGGTLVVKEPVTTDETTRDDDRFDAAGKQVYHARFRARSAYPAHLTADFDLVYQRATCAHFIPWFLDGTDGAVEAVEKPLTKSLFALATPLMVTADPTLLALEERVRATPLLQGLLAPVGVVQDIFVLKRKRIAVTAAEADLSVAVIAFNEQEAIVPVSLELRNALASAGMRFEVVLVDDGSSDGTLAAMQGLAAQDARFRIVALNPNRGIGGALTAGFDAARGNYITWIPGDGQIPPAVVLELYARRYEAPMLTTIYRTRDDAWYRMVISKTLNTMIEASTGQVAKSGGNYLFHRDEWTHHAPAADDTMMISTAFRAALRAAERPIVEVEIDCRARHSGRSKVLNPKTILRTLAGLGKLTKR